MILNPAKFVRGAPTTGPCVLIRTRHLHLVFRLVHLVVTRNCCFTFPRSQCQKIHKYMLYCLLDSGNQRSYLSDGVAKGLGIKIKSLPVLQFNMKTFLAEDMRCLKEAPIDIAVGDNSLPIKALFDSNINLNLSISRLNDLARNLNSAVFKLVADFDKPVNGEIKVEGLIIQMSFSIWRVSKK